MTVSVPSWFRWFTLGIVVFAVMVLIRQRFEWAGWVAGWAGAMFKALSGGFIGWVVSRFFTRLNLSDISAYERTEAAKTQALLIVGFALAVAIGA